MADTSSKSGYRDALIDARGLNCPMPLLKARQALMVVPKGARVTVLATDPETRNDFAAYADASGNTLLEVSEAEGIIKLVLQKDAI